MSLNTDLMIATLAPMGDLGGELAPWRPAIPAMSDEAIAKVRAVEDLSLAELPQLEIATDHVIHGGMYARTIMLPANTLLTGALVKLATILIVSGEAAVYIGGEAIELSGYSVVPASAGRKQMFIARSDVHITMIFPTDVMTVAEAERAFTDEYDRLMSETGPNHSVITGE